MDFAACAQAYEVLLLQFWALLAAYFCARWLKVSPAPAVWMKHLPWSKKQ